MIATNSTGQISSGLQYTPPGMPPATPNNSISLDKGAVKKATGKKKPKGDTFTGDSTYQSQKAAYLKAIQDYQANLQTNQSLYDTGYVSSLNTLGINQDRALKDQTNSFSGRGLLFSGMFGKAYSNTANDYARQQGDLSQQRTSYYTGNQQAKSAFLSQENLALLQAKQDAIARKAAKQ